jgi:hypothetical protein
MKATMFFKLLLFLFITLGASTSYSQDQSFCDKNGPEATNQIIREKIYENIRYLKIKIKEEGTILRLENEYDELQTSFNGLFANIKNDLLFSTGKRRVCEQYGGELETLINKAEAFNSELITTLGKHRLPSQNASDVLSIIDWISKTENSYADKDQFYSELKWDDYDAINPNPEVAKPSVIKPPVISPSTVKPIAVKPPAIKPVNKITKEN